MSRILSKLKLDPKGPSRLETCEADFDSIDHTLLFQVVASLKGS